VPNPLSAALYVPGLSERTERRRVTGLT